MKHTPGPWKWTWPEGPLCPPQLEGNVKYADMSPILVTRGCCPSCMGKYNQLCPLVPEKRNRDLIEAAPDLLEACEAFLAVEYAIKRLCGDVAWSDISRAYQLARAAKIKARGPLPGFKDIIGLYAEDENSGS